MKIQELIEDIFTNQKTFEKEVLSVKDEDDHLEIMRLLAAIIVREKLKEHTSFLHIKELSDFSLKQVKNILFKELANEWVSFAIDILDYTKEEAIAEIQKNSRVNFVHNISEKYCLTYEDIIFAEIADTFIELVSSLNQSSEKITLVNDVINNFMVQKKGIYAIKNFNQLHQHIVSAKAIKSSKISSLQSEISELLTESQSKSLDNEQKERLTRKILEYEQRVNETSLKTLEHFDAALQRVKKDIIKSLKLNQEYKLSLKVRHL